MRLRTMIRINPAIWLCPLLAFVVALYTNLLPRSSDPYALAITARGTFTLFLVASFCAACGAWEGGRIQQSGWWTFPHVRSRLVIARGLTAPVFFTGVIAIVAAVVAAFFEVRVVAWPDIRLLMMALIVIAAYTLLGFAIGTYVRPVIAVPSLFLLVFSWMSLPRILQPPWLRHLNGAWVGGFDVGADIAPQSLFAVIVLAGGLILTALILLHHEAGWLRFGYALVPTILGFGIAALLVRDFGFDPVVARDPANLVCSSTQPRVCVWPEHRTRLPEVSQLASNAAIRWRQFGVAVPTAFREETSFSPIERAFGFSMDSQPNDILSSLAYSTLPPLPACALEGRSEPYIASMLINAWLADIAGLPRNEFERRFGPDVLPIIEAIRSLSVERQRAWYERTTDALLTCQAPPPIKATP